MVTLNKPSAGDTDWATEINDNWTSLEGCLTQAICQGRLTLTSGTPVTTSDVAAATTIYFTPFRGNRIAIYNGSTWSFFSFAERSLSLSGLTASTNHDIFIYDNAGTLTLEAVAWTNDTTRATALTTQDGIYVKSGATTRRYLGTIRTTSTTGQCEDSLTKRFVGNYYNRIGKRLFTCPAYSDNDAFTSYTTTSATYTAVNGGTGAMVEWVCLGEDVALLNAFMTFSNGGANNCYVGIEIDSANNIPVASVDQPAGNNNKGLIAATHVATPTGAYRYAKMMFCRSAGTLTAFADGPRLGASADPAMTYLAGRVMV